MPDETATTSAAEERLREVHERLTRAVESLVTSDDWRAALEFAARFRTRSFNNTLLIRAQHAAAHERGEVPEPLPTFVAGFNQWQQLGRHVLKGRHGYAILAPVTAMFASSTPADALSWRRLRRGEVPRAGEVSRSRLVGVRPAYVWDVSQTSGPPIPQQPLPTLLAGEAPAGLWDGIVAQIESADFTVVSVPNASHIHGANGMTDFDGRTVSVREDMDAAARVKTAVHELGHVRMHGPDQEAHAHRGIGEVEAESVALMIGAAHGMDTSTYTVPYVASWAAAVGSRSALEIVQETGERVRRVAGEILDSLSTRQVSAAFPTAVAPPAIGAGAASPASTNPPLRRSNSMARGR